MPSLVFNQQTEVQPGITPADAQGAQFTPAVGQQIEHLGQEGGRVSGELARIQYMQTNADAVANLQKNMSEGYRNFTGYLEDQKGKVPPNGAGYTDNFVSAFSKWQDQIVAQQPTPQTKRIAAEQARTLGDHFFSRAVSWENDTRRAFRTNQLDSSIDGATSLIETDPSVYGPMLQDTLSNIKAASADLHPQQGMALQQKAIATFSQAASLSYARTHPQDTVNAILPTQPLPQDSIPAKIVTAAKGAGVDPHAALTIAQFESGMKPDAQNPKSSAHGIFQMLGSTGDQYYEPGADRNNPDAQVQAGVKFMADNAKAFRSTVGRDPTTPELYSMHLLGLGGGMALTKADPNEPFADLAQKIDPKHAAATVANNGFTGLSVGQVRDKIAGWMQGAQLKTAGLANAPTGDEAPAAIPGNLPWLNNLTPQGRQAILTHAMNYLHKDTTAGRADFEQRVNDSIAQLQSGQSPPNMPTMDEALKAYPMDKAAQVMSRLSDWQTYGYAYSKLALQSPQDQLQTLQSLKPSPGEPDYAYKAMIYNHADNALQNIQQQRAQDYLHFDMASGTKVAQPLDLSNPQTLSGPLASRFAQSSQLSQRYGLPFRAFTDQEAYALGRTLQSAKPEDALSYLSQIKGSADSPEHFMAAMSQVAKNHPALAAAAMLPPDTALKVVQGDRLLNPVDGKSALPMPDDSKIKTAWDKLRGAAYQGLPQTSALDMKAALSYYAATRPPGVEPAKDLSTDPTFQSAVKAVSPTTTYGSGRATLLPQGVSADQFGDLVAQRWEPALKAAGLDPAKYPRGAYDLVATQQPGVYLAVNGTTALPAKIDLNPQHTLLFPNEAPNPAQSQTQPPVTLKGKRLTRDDLKLPTGRRT